MNIFAAIRKAGTYIRLGKNKVSVKIPIKKRPKLKKRLEHLDF